MINGLFAPQNNRIFALQNRTGLHLSPNDDQSLKSVVDQIRTGSKTAIVVQTAFSDVVQIRPVFTGGNCHTKLKPRCHTNQTAEKSQSSIAGCGYAMIF